MKVISAKPKKITVLIFALLQLYSVVSFAIFSNVNPFDPPQESFLDTEACAAIWSQKQSVSSGTLFDDEEKVKVFLSELPDEFRVHIAWPSAGKNNKRADYRFVIVEAPGKDAAQYFVKQFLSKGRTDSVEQPRFRLIYKPSFMMQLYHSTFYTSQVASLSLFGGWLNYHGWNQIVTSVEGFTETDATGVLLITASVVTTALTAKSLLKLAFSVFGMFDSIRRIAKDASPFQFYSARKRINDYFETLKASGHILGRQNLGSFIWVLTTTETDPLLEFINENGILSVESFEKWKVQNH